MKKIQNSPELGGFAPDPQPSAQKLRPFMALRKRLPKKLPSSLRFFCVTLAEHFCDYKRGGPSGYHI